MPIVLKSGNLNLLEPSGLVQSCNGIAVHFYLDIKFHENPSNGCQVVLFVQTDMTEIIVSFLNFVNTPNNTLQPDRTRTAIWRLSKDTICMSDDYKNLYFSHAVNLHLVWQYNHSWLNCFNDILAADPSGREISVVGLRPLDCWDRRFGSHQGHGISSVVLVNTLRTGDADLRFYVTTVQDGWRKSAFLTRACFLCTIHLIMQCIEPVSEWSCWRMFIETWPHSELTFRHRASFI